MPDQSLELFPGRSILRDPEIQPLLAAVVSGEATTQLQYIRHIGGVTGIGLEITTPDGRRVILTFESVTDVFHMKPATATDPT